uniref:DUF4430 domain-containing protein n=1 Tax=candidate division WWE3 bacterium TaxID=2053526 RepID=A0A7C4XMD4_UNCKA
MKKFLLFLQDHYMIAALVSFGIVYFVFFSIASSSIGDKKSTIDDEPRKQAEEPDNHRTQVLLIIENNGKTSSLSAEMFTQNSVKDLFEFFREKGLLTYETKSYSNTVRVTEINGIKNTQTMEWKLIQKNNSEDSTEVELTQFPKTKITKQGVYILRFTRI